MELQEHFKPTRAAPGEFQTLKNEVYLIAVIDSSGI